MYFCLDDIPLAGMILKSGRGQETILCPPENEAPAVPKTAVYSLTILGVPLSYVSGQKLKLDLWRFVSEEEGRERFVRLSESSDWKYQMDQIHVVPNDMGTFSVVFDSKIKFTQSSYSRNGTHRFGFVITLTSGSTLLCRSNVFRVVSRKPNQSHSTMTNLSPNSNLDPLNDISGMIFDLDSGDIIDSWII
eukprot:gb/GECH01011661.1/.p1 GENE.gb/GECH01011661.1/~~gb/GECH01011661.1/.p1  ORF type:complete len:191 (+),score=42.95 gb/GECH01011661.1/:1-573(+)